MTTQRLISTYEKAFNLSRSVSMYFAVARVFLNVHVGQYPFGGFLNPDVENH